MKPSKSEIFLIDLAWSLNDSLESKGCPSPFNTVLASVVQLALLRETRHRLMIEKEDGKACRSALLSFRDDLLARPETVQLAQAITQYLAGYESVEGNLALP